MDIQIGDLVRADDDQYGVVIGLHPDGAFGDPRSLVVVALAGQEDGLPHELITIPQNVYVLDSVDEIG